MPSVLDHTDGVIAELEAVGLIVGDARGDGDGHPDGGGWQGPPGDSPFKAYVVLRRLGGGRLNGTLADPNEDSSFFYEIKSIGPSREGAERTADTARTVMLARPTIAGRRTLRVELDADSGVQRDDVPVPKPLFYSVERYRLDTTPA